MVGRLDRSMNPENAERIQAARGVAAFFESTFPGWQARVANKEEGQRDSFGEGWEIKGAAIDIVLSNERRTPVVGVSVADTLNPGIQRQLVREMQSKPIIRVKGEGMESRQVPRAMVSAREEEVSPFSRGETAEENPKASLKILSGMTSTLEFARNEEKNNPELQQEIDAVLEIMQQKQKQIEEATRLAA